MTNSVFNDWIGSSNWQMIKKMVEKHEMNKKKIKSRSMWYHFFFNIKKKILYYMVNNPFVIYKKKGLKAWDEQKKKKITFDVTSFSF